MQASLDRERSEKAALSQKLAAAEATATANADNMISLSTLKDLSASTGMFGLQAVKGLAEKTTRLQKAIEALSHRDAHAAAAAERKAGSNKISKENLTSRSCGTPSWDPPPAFDNRRVVPALPWHGSAARLRR